MKVRNDVSVSFDKSRKRWLVRWSGKYDPKTEKQARHCKSFKRKKDAEFYTGSLKQDRDDGICIEPVTVSLQNLCDKMLQAKKGNLSPETIDAYEETNERLLNYFGGHRNVKTISPQEAQTFINSLEYIEKEGPLSDYSRLKHLKASQVVFNYGVRSNYLRKNPFQGISIKNLSKEEWHLIRPKEFIALLEHTPELRLKALYSVMYGCGLRIGEAIHLWWDKNIDFINCQIHTRNRKAQDGFPAFRTKNYQDRSVDCPKWVINLLKQLKEQSNPKNPYVFMTNERLNHIRQKWTDWKTNGREDKWKNSTMVNNTNRNFNVHCKNAGIVTSDKLSVHCLRKGYGTNLADLGTPPHTLRALMGHSNINTTMKFYIKTTDENMKKAVQGLDNLMQAE